MERSSKDILSDMNMAYDDVVRHFDELIKEYINTDTETNRLVRKYLLAYVINNTSDNNPTNADRIINCFSSLSESIESRAIENIFGFLPSHQDTCEYRGAREKIISGKLEIPRFLGNLKRRLGFIGVVSINEIKAYFLKSERINDFAVRFENNEATYRELKQVLLKACSKY